MRATLLIIPVLLSGCGALMEAQQPVYGCYFGDALKQQCLNTAVAGDERLVCVDIAKETHFELTRCDHHISKKR